MNRTNTVFYYFAIVLLVAIPALVHTFFQGAYVVTSDGKPLSYTYIKPPPNSPEPGKYVVNPDPGRRGYWVGPISSTLPFIFLALLFLAHCFDLRSTSRLPAYCGAIAAWISMMGFTLYIIGQYRAPRLSSTTGIGIMLTPFRYLPFFLVPYGLGTIGGKLWNRWGGGKDGKRDRR
jgi:hypothetical protein